MTEYFKSTLEIHKEKGEQYLVKDMIKGNLFTGTGDECTKYLVTHHKGEVVVTYCNFITESYGTAEGSEMNPRFIKWH